MVSDQQSLESESGFAFFATPGAASVTRLSAVDTVRARILLATEHRLLATGSKLPNVRAIASGLEVSEITARRALESLVDDGVLVRRRGRGGGTFVADALPQLQDSAVGAYRADEVAIHKLIDQRSLMESSINYAAALNATRVQCDALEALLAQSEKASSWLEHHRPDSEFHYLCAEISGLPEVTTYLEIYGALIKYFVPYPMSQLVSSHQEHRELIAAFRANNAASAVEITRRHVDALRREMFVALPR